MIWKGMKELNKRLLQILLMILLSIFVFSACQEPEAVVPLETAPVEILIPLVTPEPTSQATTSPVSTPALDPKTAFDALDQEVFTFLLTGDWYTLQNFISEPATFDIDTTQIPVSWGEFSLQQMEEDLIKMEEFLSRLEQIDREVLMPQDQMGYDVLHAYLESEIEEGQFPLFYEPLSPLSGMHSTIPVLLSTYAIESQADAEAYLCLLEDSPRYLAQILEFERQKAASGLFMTQAALDMVLEQLQDLLKERDYF